MLSIWIQSDYAHCLGHCAASPYQGFPGWARLFYASACWTAGPGGAARSRLALANLTRLRCWLRQPSLKPRREERLEPCSDKAIMLEPAAEMLSTLKGAGPGQALGATLGPPAHHVIGHLWVEL